jgi:predicted XRE-type DNA-binding protein
MTDTYNSVWDAISDSPEEAENMKLRSVVMMAIEKYAKAQSETQTVIAKQLGLTQPRLNDLLKGKIDKFSLDKLVNIATKAGLSIDLTVKAA